MMQVIRLMALVALFAVVGPSAYASERCKEMDLQNPITSGPFRGCPRVETKEKIPGTTQTRSVCKPNCGSELVELAKIGAQTRTTSKSNDSTSVVTTAGSGGSGGGSSEHRRDDDMPQTPKKKEEPKPIRPVPGAGTAPSVLPGPNAGNLSASKTAGSAGPGPSR